MATVSLLTYNLLFGKAFPELVDLVKERKPDIVCLQEFEPTLSAMEALKKEGYEMAEYAHSFFKHFKFYGVVTFYNPQTLVHKQTFVINLGRSFYEVIMFLLQFGRVRRTVVHTQFLIKNTKKLIGTYNLHLTPLFGTNKVREKQIEATISHINNKIDAAAVITGDFNYPYNRRNLEELFQRHNFKEATSNLLFTFEGALFWLFRYKLKTDYILYRNLKHMHTERIKRIKSDHFPILAKFEL